MNTGSMNEWLTWWFLWTKFKQLSGASTYLAQSSKEQITKILSEKKKIDTLIVFIEVFLLKKLNFNYLF